MKSVTVKLARGKNKCRKSKMATIKPLENHISETNDPKCRILLFTTMFSTPINPMETKFES